MRIGGYGFTDHAHSPFVRRGLNEVITYKSEEANRYTPIVIGVCVHSMGHVVLAAVWLRNKPAKYGSGPLVDVKRSVWRWFKQIVRGASVLGLHGSLHPLPSYFQVVHNTMVREIFSIAALFKRQISFEDR